MSNNATAISCGNGTVAVWSRRDYDEMEDAEFISDYFGSCGVAPSKFPDLRTNVIDDEAAAVERRSPPGE